MLDIPSRAATPEPEAAADPYAWVDRGERWVKEPRNLAPALDSFLTHAHKLGAEQVMFSTFQPASFRLWGVNRKVKSRDPLDENDASLIVNHLYGADGIARLQGGADINVMYQIGSPRKGTLRFRCNVTAITASRGAGAHVVIRPVRETPVEAIDLGTELARLVRGQVDDDLRLGRQAAVLPFGWPRMMP